MEAWDQHQQTRRSTDTGTGSGSVHSAKQCSSHDLSPSTNHPQPRRQPPSNAASEPQPPPPLPDESTIRAAPALPKIKPFYTTVSDTASPHPSPETFYPRVRYIFNDDDPDLLSSALAAQHSFGDRDSTSAAGGREPNVPAVARDSSRHGHPDRAILLDLVPKEDGRGYSVGSATSLSSDWAVVDAHLSRLGAGYANAALEQAEDDTLMLEVEGISAPIGFSAGTGPNAASPADGRSRSPRADGNLLQAEDYSALIGAFDKRMAFLKRVVQNSEDRHGHLAPVDKAQDDTSKPQQQQPEANTTTG